MKIYIVTGANGFLGNTVVKKLPKDSEVRALILPGDRPDAIAGTGCKIYDGDVTNPQTLTDIFDVPSGAEVYVIHCAALVYTKSKYDGRVYDVNVNGVKNVAKKSGGKGRKADLYQQRACDTRAARQRRYNRNPRF